MGMEKFDFESYRDNLVKDIKEKRKESREDALNFLREEKKTGEYKEAYKENKKRIYNHLKTKEFFESKTGREKIRKALADIMEVIERNNVDTVVFLDKSARPLSWGLNYIISHQTPKNNSEKNIPQIKYLNIGGEKGDLPIRIDDGKHDYKYINGGNIMNAMENPDQFFVSNQVFKKEIDGLKENYKNSKNILIVDEFSSSGESLARAGIMVTELVDKNLDECYFQYYTPERRDKPGSERYFLEKSEDETKKYQIRNYEYDTMYEYNISQHNHSDPYWEEAGKNDKTRIIFFNANLYEVSSFPYPGISETTDLISKKETRSFKINKANEYRDEMKKIADEYLKDKQIEETKESVYINEPFKKESDEYEIETIDTPLSRYRWHSVLETESGKKYVEKYNQKEIRGKGDVETPDFINEYFESQLLKQALRYGILDKNKIIVPDIKLQKGAGRAYYSEFIENIFTSAKSSREFADYHNINESEYENNKVRWQAEKLWEIDGEYDKFIESCLTLLLEKETGIPLGILHLIAGDKDRVRTNYGFKTEKEKDDELIKIVVLDMVGGRGNNQDKHGNIGDNLFGERNKDEIMKYWLIMKKIINENLISKIFEKIPVFTPEGKEMKENKLKEVLNNMNNIENLIENELSTQQKADIK